VGCECGECGGLLLRSSVVLALSWRREAIEGGCLMLAFVWDS